jgi:hypothetical protein
VILTDFNRARQTPPIELQITQDMINTRQTGTHSPLAAV